MTEPVHIVLHGKQAANEELRAAVATVREEGARVLVHPTWEAGDAQRIAREVGGQENRVVAGGGDGTINEVLNGLYERDSLAELAVLPLGTANDFARSAGVPEALTDALRLAVNGDSREVDVARVGARRFLNVATGGYGTAVTAQTNPTLKKRLGGLAYLLTGIARAGDIQPVSCEISAGTSRWAGALMALAIGNGRQAGGGHVLCPEASIVDGQLDVTILPQLQDEELRRALELLKTFGEEGLAEVVVHFRVTELVIRGEDSVVLNLDGEPSEALVHEISIDPVPLRLVTPPDCPLLGSAP